MSGISLIEVGDNLPIVLQMNDGNVNQFPQAEIRDNDNNLLTTLNLIHISNGFYQVDYTMPDEIYISVVYIVYSDNYGGTESLIYGRDIDTFITTYSLKIINDKVDFLVDEAGGKWSLEGNQMIFFKSDNITEIMRFNLFDNNDNASMTNVFRRERVI